MRRLEGAVRAFFCAFVSAVSVAIEACAASGPARGWGVDAVLTRHVADAEIPAYLRLIESAGIGIVRERDVGQRQPDGSYLADVREKLRALKQRGLRVVAFVSFPDPLKPVQIANALPEDLLAVFTEARHLGRDFAGIVDAWEIGGEQDVGYCTDLPERVVAYQKAVYLGLHQGAVDRTPDAGRRTSDGIRAGALTSDIRPLILMGALALPPGPWLERAQRNGLLGYTDAYNFHFYGHAADLSGVIAAHERFANREARFQPTSTMPRRPAFHKQWFFFSPSGASEASPAGAAVLGPWSLVSGPARSALPLWITECGINAVRRSDFLNAERRRLQADFTLSTARQARTAKAVSVFMPFILVNANDPHAMTLAADRPLPAWSEYARFTREDPWPARRLANTPPTPNPIVLQWLPDNATTQAHKVSGSYRWTRVTRGRGSRDGRPETRDQGPETPELEQPLPIRGEIRVYNFSDVPVRGKLTFSKLERVRAEVSVPDEIEIGALSVRTFPISYACVGGGYVHEDVSLVFTDQSGRSSPLAFALQSVPDAADFVSVPLAIRPSGDRPKHPFGPLDEITTRSGAWIGLNTVRVEEVNHGRQLTGDGLIPSPDGTTHLRLVVTEVERDPLKSRLAVARVEQLPAEGFVRVRLDRPMSREFSLCVDLLDRRGQRFTIWENFGVSYFHPQSTDVWLRLADFHPYFWGRCTADPTFRPQDVQEIQLRIYAAKPNDPRNVSLSLMVPRTAKR